MALRQLGPEVLLGAVEEAEDGPGVVDGLLAEEVKRVIGHHFEIDGQRRIVEVDAPPLRLLDAAAHLALDLH